MKYSVILIGFALLAYLVSCSQSSDDKIASNKNEKSSEAILAQGFQVLERNCFSCHSPDADHENRIAPPMIAIKRHYIEKNTSKEAFTQALLDFVNNPSEESSKMPDALERFGLMPKMSLPEEDLRSLAAYLYDTEIETPDWFEAHYQQERKRHLRRRGKLNNLADYQKLGVEYALATKAVLGKNLLGAIKNKGTVGALEFCNTKAYPLTDSMATVLKAHIKRVSDRNRNPDNKANTRELAYIEQAQALLAKGQKVKPKAQEVEGKVLIYAPIISNQMCLQCHGQKTQDITPETFTKIKELYPEDRATAYKVNQLRGIWVISLDKSQK